jgi:hypothetical protein
MYRYIQYIPEMDVPVNKSRFAGTNTSGEEVKRDGGEVLKYNMT